MPSNSFFKNAVILMLTTFVFHSCSKENAPSSQDLMGSWKVIYFTEDNLKITKAEKTTWPEVNNGDITANFSKPDTSGKGTVSGITVSNGYTGEYTVQENGQLSIGPIATTFVNEPEWTALFMISSAEYFEIKNTQLFIYYNAKKNSIVLERN